MVDADPTKVVTIDIASRLAADTAELTDLTPCVTDGVTGTSCNVGNVKKIGKSPDDALRVEFAEDKANLAVGNTITLHLEGAHNWTVGELLAYNSATGVTATARLTATLSGGTCVFTITAAWIAELFDQGSGKWAFRFNEDNSFLDGDIKISEIEADLTVGAARRRFPQKPINSRY